jgi:hypothetical protein
MTRHPLITLLLLLCALGCDGPFSRPIPQPTEYKQRFLTPRFQPEEISDLQYSYRGAVGGESSIARFRLTIEELARIKAATPVATPYKTSSKQEVDELKRTFAFCARDGRIPKWFDFPFSKSLLLFENSGDYTDGHPSFSHKWFVDEDQCVVYFVMTEG